MARVYVADDEKNIRDLIASFLCEQSLEVEVFETGDQLFLRFLEEEADVIINSIHKVVKYLRSISPVWEKIQKGEVVE